MTDLMATMTRLAFDEKNYDELDKYYHPDFMNIRELEMLDYVEMKRHVVEVLEQVVSVQQIEPTFLRMNSLSFLITTLHRLMKMADRLVMGIV